MPLLRPEYLFQHKLEDNTDENGDDGCWSMSDTDSCQTQAQASSNH